MLLRFCVGGAIFASHSDGVRVAEAEAGATVGSVRHSRAPVIYRFGDCEIDPARSELRRGGNPVAIQPKPLALLVHLLSHRDRVVPKEELLTGLWPDAVVTDSSLTRAVSLARKALGEGAGERLRSVARRGYRFVGDVIEVADETGGDSAGTVAREPASKPASSPEARARSHTESFVGREEPLRLLRAAWANIAKSEGSVVLIGGPPGIGKTFLLEAFAAEVRASGVRILSGREDDTQGAPPFWLWVQLLRALDASGSLEGPLEALGPDAAVLKPLLPGGGSEALAPASSHDSNRFELFDSLVRVLLQVAESSPLVLLLEDIHWSGRGSLLLFEHLARELVGASILVVTTIRDEPREAGHPLVRTLSIVGQLSHVRSVELPGFSRHEVVRLLEERMGRLPPDLLVDELHGRTEGNPLYVREGLRLLADHGALEFPELNPGWSLDLLPRRTGDLVARHLESLSAESRELLEGAAVFGREIRVGPLAALWERSRAEVLDALDEATAAGLLVPVPDGVGRYRFAHPLYREVTYAALPPGRRARTHQRVGEILEEQPEGSPELPLSEVAHHFHLGLPAGDAARALDVAMRAAERAAGLFAWEQAALHYEQALAALEHAERLNAAQQLEVLLRLGEAHRFAGERTRRREVLLRALVLARARDDTAAIARAAISFCDLSEWSPRDEEGLQVLEEALAGIADTEVESRARLLTRVAYLVRRDRVPGEAAAREAIRLAREVGDADTLHEALYTLHLVLSGPDGLAERRVLMREAAEVAPRGTYRDLAFIGLVDLAADRLHEGDRAAALRARAAAEEFGGERPHRGMRWHLEVFDAGLALLEGRYDVAERKIREHLLLGRMIEHPYAGMLFAGQTIGLLRDRGQLEVIGKQIPSLRELAGTTAHANLAARATAAGMVGETGDWQPARDLVEEAVTPELCVLPREHWWTPAVVGLADLVARLRDPEKAALLYEAMEPWAELHSVTPGPILYGGPVSRSLGLMALVQNEPEIAAGHFEQAIAQSDALGARPMMARSQLASGQVLRRLGRAADAERPLRQAVAGAAEIGLAGVGEEAATALQDAEMEEEIPVTNW